MSAQDRPIKGEASSLSWSVWLWGLSGFDSDDGSNVTDDDGWDYFAFLYWEVYCGEDALREYLDCDILMYVQLWHLVLEFSTSLSCLFCLYWTAYNVHI